MARSRSSRSGRSSGRSSYGGGGGGGGGGNSQTPMIIAIVLVVGAVGAFIMLSGDNKKKGTPVPVNETPDVQHPGGAKPDKPAAPTRMAVPKIGNEIFSQARELVKEIKVEYQAASDLYDDAQVVKDDDPDMWQSMLREANTHMGAIQDLWNEIIGLMPSNADWDEEETADHWLGREYQKVGKVDQLRMAIRKNMRSK